MAKRYGAFVVRYWWLAPGAVRVEVEHVQSGERVRVGSLAAALAWLEGQMAPPETSAPPGQPGGAAAGAAAPPERGP